MNKQKIADISSKIIEEKVHGIEFYDENMFRNLMQMNYLIKKMSYYESKIYKKRQY